MKYCPHCGSEVHPEAVICVKCGCSIPVENPPAPAAAKDDTMQTVIKIFLIIGCIVQGWTILPLAWMIPITVAIFKRMNSGQPVGTGLKVAALLLVNLVAGICLLCTHDD